MGKLKSENFIHRRVLITAISMFPAYVEWPKASVRATLLWKTKEELRLEREVAAM